MMKVQFLMIFVSLIIKGTSEWERKMKLLIIMCVFSFLILFLGTYAKVEESSQAKEQCVGEVGAVYTRWGGCSCSSDGNTELVYSGSWVAIIILTEGAEAISCVCQKIPNTSWAIRTMFRDYCVLMLLDTAARWMERAEVISSMCCVLCEGKDNHYNNSS